MSDFDSYMFTKGYVRLQPGSYHVWVSKKWHEMFVRRGFVKKNFYKQYCPNMDTIKEFITWLTLYDKSLHDRDFPRSNPLLKKEELEMIQREVK